MMIDFVKQTTKSLKRRKESGNDDYVEGKIGNADLENYSKISLYEHVF